MRINLRHGKASKTTCNNNVGAVLKEARHGRVVPKEYLQSVSSYSFADKLLAPKNRFYCRQKFGSRVDLQNVSASSIAQGRPYGICIVVLAHEKNLHAGNCVADST